MALADLVAQKLAAMRAKHAITLEFLPGKAPNHVRNFLRLASVGFYDGTAFHRVVKGFVLQGGFLPTRTEPLDISQDKYVRKLQPEFNDTPHDKGIVSMAHGEDPASADTSFFIVTARTPVLDGKYTAFARVVEGMDDGRPIMPPSAFFTAPPFLSFSSTEGSVVIILTIGLN